MKLWTKIQDVLGNIFGRMSVAKNAGWDETSAAILLPKF